MAKNTAVRIKESESTVGVHLVRTHTRRSGEKVRCGYSNSTYGLKTAALKAVELDDTLSEAHVSLANARLWEWSWSAAEKELQRAISLDPNNAMAHQLYGYLLSAQGRFEEAIAEMKRARELDSLSPNKQNSLGATLYRAGRYDEALEQFREVPDPDANSEFRHRRMAAIYERKGMWTESMNQLVIALKYGGKKELAVSVQRKFMSSGYAGEIEWKVRLFRVSP